MKKSMFSIKLMISSVLFLFSIMALLSQEIVTVNTFTYGDITKRRGIYKFPDGTDSYRKILMYYTLKCDRQTAQDVFDCGEWDYLAYCRIFQHTGIMDSNLTSAATYNWGRGVPEKLFFTNQPTFNSRIVHYKNTVIDNVISENEFAIGTETTEITLGNKPTRFQILMTKDHLKQIGASGKDFSRIALFNKGDEVHLKNFKVQYIFSSNKELSQFVNGNFVTLFQGDYTFSANSQNYIDLAQSFKPSTLQGIILQFTYDDIINDGQLILNADNLPNCVITQEEDKFLEFDARFDYTFSDDIKELSNLKKFTVEFWYRLHEWRGGVVMQITNALDFRLAEEYNQPRRYYISMSDSIGYGIMVGGNVDHASNWNHFAFVYDANKGQYDGRIKFYINGNETTTNIRGIFPNAIPNLEHILKLNAESGNNKADFDEFRVWGDALDIATIRSWQNKSIKNTHPNYQNLIVYYSMNEQEDFKLIDESGKNHNATLIGVPIQRSFSTENLSKEQFASDKTPQLWIYEGQYDSHTEDYFDTIRTDNSKMSIITYELGDRKTIIKNIEYVNEPGVYYTYNVDGAKTDSTIISATDSLMQDTIRYYAKPYEKLNDIEIARYITPYGKYLSLGPDGFTWIYDVTEYAELLKGDVDIAAHNQQELLDLKFEFYKGTPPRDVIKTNRPWGQWASYSYRDLDNDTKLDEKEIDLQPETKAVMMRTRLTGHGHNSTSGNYPHCCEWKDNTHYLYADGEEVANWKIWRNFECGLNPVFPQGGTWNGQREGWCPGDVVYNYDFDLTDYIKDNKIKVDYDITPVPADNQGMGGGNYVVAMELFEFGKANHSLDAEVYDIISPNAIRYYSRINPICSNPNIVIRNNSENDLTSLMFIYKVSGGKELVYNWTGLIKTMQKDTIELPVESSSFWLGDDNNIFSVRIGQPNGETDQYDVNDTMTTSFNKPDLYQQDMVIWYQTNAEPQYYTYRIKDIYGNIVFEKKSLSQNQLYKDEIILPDGCYTLEFLSMRHTGLSYWAYQGQGSGSLRIYNKAGQLLKTFNPDFGTGIIYSFDLGGVLNVEDPGYENLMSLYPNPTDGEISITLDYFKGMADFEVYDTQGKLVLEEKVFLNQKFNKTINLGNYPKGTYLIRIVNKEFDIVKKFIRK